MVLQLVISYLEMLSHIVSALAPEKDLTVAVDLRSLFLMPFNIELPRSNVGWFIFFLESVVRSIVSSLSRLFGLVLWPRFGL